MNKDDNIIKTYNNKIIELQDINNFHLIWLHEKKDELIVELEISVRMWHRVQEEFIRSKLEIYIEMIDKFKEYNFNIDDNHND